MNGQQHLMKKPTRYIPFLFSNEKHDGLIGTQTLADAFSPESNRC
jgi:hypothetical protein